MQTVFQGETGGFLAFDYDATINPVSGYINLISQTHYVYPLPGLLVSGQLYIQKSLMSVLPPDKYIGYPQLLDVASGVWFLDEVDIEVEFVPNEPLAYVTVRPGFQYQLDSKEPYLGVPAASGYVLKSTIDGIRYWSTVDHGELDGLLDDDHPQYHTDARGDARYWQLTTDLATQAELDAAIASGIGAFQPIDGDLTAISALSSLGIVVRRATDVWTTRTITGTPNRLSVTNGNGVTASPVLDIDVNYAGQSSITTVGNILTGTWNADIISPTYGGTGVNNGSSLLTVPATGTAALLEVANIFTLGPNQFRAGDDNNVALSAQRNSSSATANIFEVQDENGTALAYTTVSGGAVFKSYSAIGANAAINDSSLFHPTFVFRSPLSIQQIFTDLTTPDHIAGLMDYVQLDPAADATSTFAYAYNTEIATKTGNTKAVNTIAGVFNLATHGGSGAVTTLYGIASTATNNGGGTATTLHGLSISANTYGGSTTTTHNGINISNFIAQSSVITTLRGIYYSPTISSSTITNHYGIYLENVASATTLNYAVWTNGGTVMHRTGSTTVVGLVVKGVTSQTANLTEWWDVSNNVLANVTPAGGAVFKGHSAFGASGVVDTGSLLYPGQTYKSVISLQEIATNLGATTYTDGIVSYLQLDPTASSSATTYGADIEIATKSGNNKNFNSLTGIFSGAIHEGTGTLTAQIGLNAQSYSRGGGTVTTNRGIIAVAYTYNFSTTTNQTGIEITNGVITSGNVTNLRGLYYTPSISAAAITNHYGIYLNAVTGGSALNYAIFTAGGLVEHDTGAAATKGLVVKGFTSQTANLQEWQNSAGTATSYITSSGNIFSTLGVGIGAVPAIRPPYSAGGTTGFSLDANVSLYSQTPITTLALSSASNGYTNLYISPVYNLSSNSAHLLLGAFIDIEASGTINYGTLGGMRNYITNNSTGTVSSAQGLITGTYNIGSGIITSAHSHDLFYQGVSGSSATNVFLAQGSVILNGTATATNVWTFQAQPVFSSTSTVTTNALFRGVMTSINASATITNNYGLWIDKMVGGSTVQRAIQTDGGTVQFNTGTATITGLVVKGFTSQTANLQEWRNSSDTGMVYVTASGNIAIANGKMAIGDVPTFTPVFFTAPSVSTNARLIVNNATAYTTMPNANTFVNIFNELAVSGQSNISNSLSAAYNNLVLTGTVTYAFTSGLSGAVNKYTTGTVSEMDGVAANVNNWSTGTVANMFALNVGYTVGDGTAASVATTAMLAKADMQVATNATVTNAYGFAPRPIYSASSNVTTSIVFYARMTSINASANVTNSYGLRIDKMTGGSTIQRAIQTDGGTVEFDTGTATITGLIVKGFTSQTATLQEWQDVNANVLGSISASGTHLVRPRDAITNTTTAALILGHASSGTPAASFGSRLLYQLQSSTTPDQDAATIDTSWVVATHASRTARVVHSVYDTAAREGFRIEADGSNPKIGFLGAAAVVRQTVNAAATDATTTQNLVNSIRTALINLGLVV